MKKGKKIAIGVGGAAALTAATVGLLYAKNKKKKTKAETDKKETNKNK